MSEMLAINELIKWKMNEENPTIERILWIDDGNIIAYVMDINAQKGFPSIRKVNDVLDGIETGNAEKVEDDPWQRLIREEEIDEKQKLRRDEIWHIIEPLVKSENEPDIYKREERGELVKEVTEKYNISIATAYKHLRRYWQRGKNKNAFLPDYEKCGGKGKLRISENKLGRPRKHPELMGEGINITEDTKKIFRIAYNRYYNNQKENTFQKAYELMLKDFYQQDYIIDENGERKPQLIPISEIPTITQFRYWYEKEVKNNIKKKIISRKGEKIFELQHRAVTGKSDTFIAGPGALYQIDATIADVYLVSKYNPEWIIGRPVVYFIVDVFSRIITGMYVGLEGPSWAGAMMALANAAADKVQYCKQYGIDITTEQWPCRYVPEAILGDNGEIKSNYIQPFAEALNIRIENASSYRADWKGIVEQLFHTIQGKTKPFLPGTIRSDFRKRGGKDYRLDAKLNLDEFTKLMITCVLSHNNQEWMDNYEQKIEMIEDDISPIPLHIWNWGIVNCSGRLRSYPEDIIKLNLMPTANVRITRNGIKFKKMYYGSDKALTEQWFETARNKGSWSIAVSYDPRNMNQLYIRSEDGRDFEECWLLESNQRYFDKRLEDLEYLWAMEDYKKKQAQQTSLQATINLDEEIEKIVQESQKKFDNHISIDISDTKKLQNIRSNRHMEKINQRQEEAFQLG